MSTTPKEELKIESVINSGAYNSQLVIEQQADELAGGAADHSKTMPIGAATHVDSVRHMDEAAKEMMLNESSENTRSMPI